MPVIGHKKEVERALPGTSLRIAGKTGVHSDTVLRWIRQLRKEGACHIGGWERTVGVQGAYKPVYFRGPGADVACPFKRLTSAEYCTRHRARIKKDGREEVRARKQTANYYANKAAKGRMRDPLVDALFGRAA
jgi:transposase-like protein